MLNVESMREFNKRVWRDEIPRTVAEAEIRNCEANAESFLRRAALIREAIGWPPKENP